ncbi:MAG: tetratricopeptide repeat protein [Planctomycetes bacterium]|nr:tetratricopeptide repeat protein [Planctomycetota bacterium]
MSMDAKQRRRAGVVVAMVLLAGVIGGTWHYTRGPEHTQASPSITDPVVRDKLEEAHTAAQHYIVSNEHAKARKILEAVLADYPNDAPSHVLLAQVLIAEGKTQDAYDHVAEGLKYDEGNPEAHFLAGRLAQELDNLDKAKFHFTRASMLDPNQAKYPLYLGAVLLRQGDLDAAQLQLLRAQRIDTSLAVAYSMQAEIAARRGKIDMAIEEVNKAIDLSKDDAAKRLNYVLQKAQLLRRNNDPAAALSLLTSLDTADQQKGAVVEHIADCYQMMNQPAKAAAVWSELFALEPTNARAAGEAAWAYHRADDDRHARQYIDMALRIDPREAKANALRDALAKSN